MASCQAQWQLKCAVCPLAKIAAVSDKGTRGVQTSVFEGRKRLPFSRLFQLESTVTVNLSLDLLMRIALIYSVNIGFQIYL